MTAPGTVLLIGVLLSGTGTLLSAQASTGERLTRVRTDLFSRAAHLDDDVRELKQILAVDPRSAEGHALLGIAYRIMGTPDLSGEIVAEFRQALDLDPSAVAVRVYLARVYLDLGRAARAREELETALAQAPGNPECLALLGETQRQLREPGRAVDLIRQALRRDASLAQARYYLGLALFDLGQREDAINELERVVRSSPGVADPYLALGTAYLDAGRVRQAVRTLGQGTRIDPTQPELHILLARAYRSSGLLDKAEAQLALAAPTRGAARGMSDYQHQRFESDLYLERGLLEVQRGRLAAAAEAFRKVLEMDPDHGPANRDLAQVYLRQGLYAPAHEHAVRAAHAGFPLQTDELQLLRQRLQTKKGGG